MNPEATRKAEAQARLARFAETPFDANVDYLAFGAFSFDVARALSAGSHTDSGKFRGETEVQILQQFRAYN